MFHWFQIVINRILLTCGVLYKEESTALHTLIIMEPKGIIKHITINDTPEGRNVEETLRIIQAFPIKLNRWYIITL